MYIFLETAHKFEEAVTVRNFQHPKVPSDANFVQLGKHRRPKSRLTKGHWSQTLRRRAKFPWPKIQNGRLVNPNFRSSIDRFKDFAFQMKNTKDPEIGNEHTPTASPDIYSTIYYDDLPTTTSNNNNAVFASQSESVRIDL